jgi:organic radical activating enzyme
MDVKKEDLLRFICDQLGFLRIVVTGGEPLLQQKELTWLVGKLKHREFEIETNGTIKPNYTLNKRCKFSVSPKKQALDRVNPKDFRDAIFKFVVSDESDANHYIRWFERFGLKREDSLYFMPLSSSRKELELNAKKVAQLALLHNVKYSDRLQLRLWGKS